MTVYVHQLYRNITLNKQAIEKYKLQLAAWSAYIAGTPLLPSVSNSILFFKFFAGSCSRGQLGICRISLGTSKSFFSCDVTVLDGKDRLKYNVTIQPMDQVMRKYV